MLLTQLVLANMCTDSMITLRTQSDVKAECMQTPGQQPEPEQSSGCSVTFYLFIFLVENQFALKRLWAGFGLCCWFSVTLHQVDSGLYC